MDMQTKEEIAFKISKELGASKANKESAIYRACLRMAGELEDSFNAIMEENCLRIAVKTKELLLEKAAERFREELQQVVSLMNYVSPGSGNIIEIEKSVDHFIKKIEDRI